ncbi:MAG: DUF99 family protein [Thermoplasmata archaeon]
MRRALAKPHVRVVGIDDGAFQREDLRAPVAAVTVSAPQYVESVAVGSVEVDGRDATERVIALVRTTGHLSDLRAALVDGVVLGGFNVLDLDRLYRELGLPIVSVTRRAPDFERIRAALVKWFPRDARRRFGLVRAHRLFRVPTLGRPLFASAVGCRQVDALALIHRTTVRGFWPEPLRLAHIVASAAGARGAARAKD